MDKRRRFRGVLTGFVEQFMPTDRHSEREMPVRYNSPKKSAKPGRKPAGGTTKHR